MSHINVIVCIVRRFGLHSRQLSYTLNLTVTQKGSFNVTFRVVYGFLLEISYLSILVTHEFVLLLMWLESLFCFNDNSSLKMILTTSQRANGNSCSAVFSNKRTSVSFFGGVWVILVEAGLCVCSCPEGIPTLQIALLNDKNNKKLRSIEMIQTTVKSQPFEMHYQLS